ncbi:DUF4352 domain-containing protein [Anaerolineae bacterium CFX7]|nr:DUF4352 domain-containing protein [Anaerolineae bacterium CFX7]
MHACSLFPFLVLFFLLGCTRTDLQITPLSHLGSPTAVQNNTEPKSITLPTPQIQSAAHGYFQDDDGLRLSIAAINTKIISPSYQDERNSKYLVLTLTLTNFSLQPKDITGFPFSVWVRDVETNQEYAPELYAPTEIGMWQMIDKLNTGTIKHLDKNQTVRGELFFQVPANAYQFDLIWQPHAQRRWILSVPKLR